MIGEHAQAIDTADRWLQSDHAYFLFWRARDGRASAVIAADEATLLSESLDCALKLGDSSQSTLLFAITDTSMDAEALSWWSKHGGLTVKRVPGGH
jgi:hypothetical protein